MRRGFTMVELMVVIAVTSIGFMALLNLQIGSIKAIANARDHQGALVLAEHVAQTMQMEGMQWTPSDGALSNFTTFRFLKNAPVNSAEGETSGWLIGFPQASGVQDIRVGMVGSDGKTGGYDEGIFQEVGDQLNGHYCVHYRLTWLVPDLLLRADIRIMWPRDRANFGNYQKCPVGMEHRLEDINQLSVPVTILRNVFVKQVT